MMRKENPEKLKTLDAEIKRIEGEFVLLQDKLKQKDATIERLSGELAVLRAVSDAEKNPELITGMLKKLSDATDREYFTKMLERLDSIAKKDYPEPVSEVSVSNLDEITIPDRVTINGWGALVQGIQTLIFGAKSLATNIFKAEVTGKVQVTNNDLTEAIPVRLVSRDMRFFYDAMVSVAGSGGPSTDTGLLGQIIAALQAPSTIGNGFQVVAVPGTAVQLSAASTTCRRVTIRARDTNSNYIYIGGNTVSSTSGAFLLPTESIVLNVGNLNDVWIDSAIAGEGVQYTYEA